MAYSWSTKTLGNFLSAGGAAKKTAAGDNLLQNFPALPLNSLLFYFSSFSRQHHHPLPLVVGRIDRLYQVVTRCKFTREVVQQSSSEFGVSLKVISLWGLHGGYNEKTQLNAPPPPQKKLLH
jgi:hypothetical protein